jgi:hypothetical protein
VKPTSTAMKPATTAESETSLSIPRAYPTGPVRPLFVGQAEAALSEERGCCRVVHLLMQLGGFG